jgi:hypothetical protein
MDLWIRMDTMDTIDTMDGAAAGLWVPGRQRRPPDFLAWSSQQGTSRGGPEIAVVRHHFAPLAQVPDPNVRGEPAELSCSQIPASSGSGSGSESESESGANDTPETFRTAMVRRRQPLGASGTPDRCPHRCLAPTAGSSIPIATPTPVSVHPQSMRGPQVPDPNGQRKGGDGARPPPPGVHQDNRPAQPASVAARSSSTVPVGLIWNLSTST